MPGSRPKPPGWPPDGRPGRCWSSAMARSCGSPSSTPSRRHPAVAPGWHRQFCIQIDGFRGTPETPGLMLALMRGGRCTGLALEVDGAATSRVLFDLVKRRNAVSRVAGQRPLDPAGHGVRTADRAGLLCRADRRADPARASLPQAAAMLARACGHGGSGAEYLRETVTALEESGLRDRNLWNLQRLVAAEIDRM